jgi:DNA-binding response OmpR family regulator
MNNLIYVADNDLATSRGVQDFLTTHDFDVECFKTGEQLYNAFQFKKCALAILSLAMPDKDSFEIGAKVKQQGQGNTAVIILTPEASGEDHAFSVSLGMDAYLAKPLCMSRLTSYVRALLVKSQHAAPPAAQPPRPASASSPHMQTYGDISVCQNKRTATCGHTQMPLTGTELQMLTLLMENQHKAISRAELLGLIWGQNTQINPRATDDIVKRLRRKLKNAGSQVSIDTVWGFGFRLAIM